MRIYDNDSQISVIAPNLYHVENIFSEATFKNLQGLNGGQVGNERPENWAHDHTCLPYRFILAENSPSFSLTQEMGQAMQKPLSKLVKNKLTFMLAKTWLDISGFHCAHHHDDPSIVLTMQVYLWGHGETYGTHFYHVEPHVEIPWKLNCGYINHNIDLKDHWSPPGAGSRLTIAWQYKHT